jgi:thiol:disulfide interchange protein DsbD
MRAVPIHVPALAVAMWAGSVASDPAVPMPAAEARLIAETRVIQPGTPITVGIHIRMPARAHIYWTNPGDAGLRTRVEWKLPPGFTAGPVQWPVPARFVEPSLASYGYADEVVLPVALTPPADLAGVAAVRIAARVDWLLCREACVPGGADLGLGFRVGADPGAPTPEAALIRRFVERIPREDPTWHVRFMESDTEVILAVRPPPGVDERTVGSFIFIPAMEDLIEPAAPQTWRDANGEYRLRLPKTPRRLRVEGRIEGVLREGNGYPLPPDERFWSVSAERTSEHGAWRAE